MPFLRRYLTPLFRSRKRWSLLLAISVLLCLALILFTVDRQIESNEDLELILTTKKTKILLNALKRNSTRIGEK